MAIRVLPDEVVDRIAAGEVLERPANLVKELLENSLDAGATELDIEFDQGGRRVVINDDGAGMSNADLALCLRRHATSKIANSEDLFNLSSFGFRGEALASVAAVSRLILTSRARGEAEAHRLQSDFGSTAEPVTVSGRPGTEIRVNDLFENVPARLKFLKSEAAEHTQIKNVIKALALAHEDVGFRVKSRGELVFHWPKGQSFLERAKAVLGTEDLHAGQLELEGLRADVLVGSPQLSANVNRNIWLFCQRRWIQDRSLSAAVMEAYRNLLMTGQYPTAVVRLACPPDVVDVNVHPAKSQVKFQNAQLAFRVTTRAVRQVLETAPWLKGAVAEAKSFEAAHFGPTSEAEAQSSLKFADAEFERTQYPSKAFPLAQVREAVRSYSVEAGAATVAAGAGTAAHRWENLQVIGQADRTYILAQSEDSFYMIDQHAAHERVMFERLMESFRHGRMEVQNLLLPLTLDFQVEEIEALLARREIVERFGISLDRMGPGTLAVQAIPSLVKEEAIAEALRKLAIELAEGTGEAAWETAVGEVFASMACHSVIRAGQTLSLEEMRSLLSQMDQFPLSSFCPHGRPVYIQRRFAEIEREFGRIV